MGNAAYESIAFLSSWNITLYTSCHSEEDRENIHEKEGSSLAKNTAQRSRPGPRSDRYGCISETLGIILAMVAHGGVADCGVKSSWASATDRLLKENQQTK
jgi:hypothetical protein